jgi:hypothetical protein
MDLTHYQSSRKGKRAGFSLWQGRHSIYLNQLGFTVLGADLSEQHSRSC